MNFLRNHIGWLLPIFLMGLITPLSSSLDLNIERLFYQENQFPHNALYQFIFDYGAFPGEAVGIISFLLFVYSLITKKWMQFRSSALVMILTVLLGAGFIVHVVLKDHWGRPRPRQTIEFGGKQEFRPYYSPNFFHQPEPSKSFPCGHCSMGFSFFTLVFIGRRLKNRALTLGGWTAASFFGAALSFARMAQGGHFFSDVLMTALIMWLTAYACDYLIHSLRSLKFIANPVPEVIP